MGIYTSNYWASTAEHAAAVTASDSADLPHAATKGIYTSDGGDIVVVTVSGETVTFASVPAGGTIPVQIARVKSTSTTATSIFALY